MPDPFRCGGQEEVSGSDFVPRRHAKRHVVFGCQCKGLPSRMRSTQVPVAISNAYFDLPAHCDRQNRALDACL